MATSPQNALAHLKQIAEASPTNAIDEALRREVWTPGTPWHCEEVLCYCAQLAADLGEYQLAGLAAYQAQWLHKQSAGQEEDWGLPILSGLETAARDFNLVRYTPLRSRNVMLRRPEVTDREFLTTLFTDDNFIHQYSRTAHGEVTQRVHRLILGAGQAPNHSTLWAWIVCDNQENQIGLMEFSSPDFIQGSVDMTLGFLQPHFGTLAGEAYVIGALIAFHHLDLVRITGHIYGDNERSRKLESRIGRIPEYTLDGLVTDGVSGEDIPLTVYAMFRHEFQHWPHVKRVMRRYFPPTAPDLLREKIYDLTTNIVGRGPSWDIFPPPVIPVIPAPETNGEKPSQAPPPSLPEQVELDGVRLRPMEKDDESQVSAWLKMEEFLATYPHHLPMSDVQAMIHGCNSEESTEYFWMLEERHSKGDWQSLGLIGIELLNQRPVMFIVTGFARPPRPKTLRSLRLLIQSEIFSRSPAAIVYLKVPQGSHNYAIMTRLSHLQHCGTQRQYLIPPGNIRLDMAYFKVIPEPDTKARQTPS